MLEGPKPIIENRPCPPLVHKTSRVVKGMRSAQGVTYEVHRARGHGLKIFIDMLHFHIPSIMIVIEKNFFFLACDIPQSFTCEPAGPF